MLRIIKKLFKKSPPYEEIFTSNDEQQAFELWAFGRTPQSYTVKTMLVWNSRHGKLYYAKEIEEVCESIKHMVRLWKEHENDEPST